MDTRRYNDLLSENAMDRLRDDVPPEAIGRRVVRLAAAGDRNIRRSLSNREGNPFVRYCSSSVFNDLLSEKHKLLSSKKAGPFGNWHLTPIINLKTRTESISSNGWRRVSYVAKALDGWTFTFSPPRTNVTLCVVRISAFICGERPNTLMSREVISPGDMNTVNV